MDPNPTRFPILSYVMSRLHSASHQSVPINDLEAPDPSSSSQSSSRRFETELVERFPYLQHPDMLSSMARAVSDVAQTRSVLQGLGKRPDHETLDAARSHIADIDVELTLQLDEIAYGEADIAEIEKECRVKADAQKLPYKALLNLDEMHEAYEKLLKDAEERLEKIYVSSAGYSFPLMQDEEEENWQLNEEVVAILQEASVKCVERVELSGRRLKFLPEAFGRMRGLVALDVSNNRLESIPDAIAWMEQLQELYLSANLLASLPDSIGLLLKLKILDVSSNKLKVFPDSISNCRSLVELNASYNELTHLPTSIGYGLLNLQELRVYFNKLRSLPASICEMRSLRLLDAHFNELSRLPLEIGKLTNLEILNLSSNFSDLTELPPSFGDLISLRELDASNNQIRALPEFFFRLHNLSRLDLDQNPLLVPPPEIAERGAVAVRLYMKNWHEALLEEERRRRADEVALSGAGWLTRSTSWLNGFASRVSGTVAEYLGESFSDPCLYEQR